MNAAERVIDHYKQQERRYQLLQAAAVILSSGRFTSEEAVIHAETILDILERKDKEAEL